MTREQIIARQKELLNQARQAGRAMNADERAEFDSLQKTLDEMTDAGANDNTGQRDGNGKEQDSKENDEENDGDT